MRRRVLTVVLAGIVTAGLAPGAGAQAPEKPKLTVVVGAYVHLEPQI